MKQNPTTDASDSATDIDTTNDIDSTTNAGSSRQNPQQKPDPDPDSPAPKKLPLRLLQYFGGLLVMTIGIAFSVKSNLGVSPVSSIPYTITCVTGAFAKQALDMGIATIFFHCALVLIQLLVLRKNFKLKILLQIPVGVVFGLFTTACNKLLGLLSDLGTSPVDWVIRFIFMLLSAFFIALGIFIYLPANIIPLAGEGAMSAVSQVTKIEFSKVKIAFDASMVTISLVTCLCTIHKLGSVGVGTIISAFLVGFIHGILTKIKVRRSLRNKQQTE